MNNQFILITAIGFILVISLSGCVTNPIAWSPDGRYIAFTGMDDEKLWVWDNQSQTITLYNDDHIRECRFVNNGEELLYTKSRQDPGEYYDFFKTNIHSHGEEVLVEKAALFFDTSDDGKYLFYLKEDEEKKQCELWQIDITTKENTRLFGQQDLNIDFVDVDSSGQRFLFTADKSHIALWEKGDTGKLKLLKENNTRDLVFPQWLDHDRYFYYETDNDNDVGNLILDSIKSPNPNILCQDVCVWDLPSITPNKKTIIVSVRLDEKNSQLIEIDLTTGEKKLLTNHIFGASWGALSPDGKKLAYIPSPYKDESHFMLRLLNLENGKEQIIWRNHEERLFAISEALFQQEEYALAVSSYHDLLALSPGPEMANMAWLRIMQSYLTPLHLDLDKAFEALNEMPQPDIMAHSLFWKETVRTVSDPADDWIEQYGTKESQEKFGFNTDSTRDLRGLAIKHSDQRLFLKVDYNSNRDLSGLTFSDTIILLDYDSPNSGCHTISNITKWDRGAERIIALRHWYEQGRDSQYDMAIMNEKGENITYFLAAGFSPPKLPHFDLIEIQGQTGSYFLSKTKETIEDVLGFVGIDPNASEITVQQETSGEEGSIVFSIAKDILDLPKNKKIFIQVCVLKGGIESYQKTERPQKMLIDNKLVCDVADAFGNENTAQRILNEVKAGKPAIIKGYGAVLEMQ